MVVAGAIAVAVAVAVAGPNEGPGQRSPCRYLLFLPGLLKHAVIWAWLLRLTNRHRLVFAASAWELGISFLPTSTVPFALWGLSKALDDFETAPPGAYELSGVGDRDTTCAIVGGIVGLVVGENALPVRMGRR